MKKIYILNLLFVFLAFASCESDEVDNKQPFVAAFENLSHELSAIPVDKEIKMVFSEPAASSGTVIVKVTPTNAVYGDDFETLPSAESGTFEIPFEAGQKGISFLYINRIEAPFGEEDQQKSVLFQVVQINYVSQTSVQGYSSSLVGFGSSLGATLLPEIGGPNQGDQVYIDLSTEIVTKARRDSWDLGFYSGTNSRVVLNGSVYMAARQLESTNIDAVTQASVQQYFASVSVGTFDPVNAAYIDAPNGDITKTAIAEISDTENDNKVYLVNLGYQIGNTTPAPGSVAIAGNPRGWKKIRILKNGDNYVLQYADLTSATHQEVTIPINEAYNFSFFSFNTQNLVNVEPEKSKWDLNFSVFTNIIEGSGSYGYSDFVINNLKAGVKAYRVENAPGLDFPTFSKANIDDSKFTDDQRIIGADWRDVFGSVFTNRFYILKDIDGNYYKIRMLAFVDQGGVRGHPKFEYKLVQ